MSSSGHEFDPTDPAHYANYWPKWDGGVTCENDQIDKMYGEYLAIYGQPIDLYLVTKYDPEPVFGEDPIKKYEIPPIRIYGMFDVTGENVNFGKFEKTAETVEEFVVYFHKTTTRALIRRAMLDAGFISIDDTIEDESQLSKYDRHRKELQEADIIKVLFNNIYYEIDSVKTEEQFQPLLRKYVYQVSARPRLISAEEPGFLDEIPDADDVRQEHIAEIETAANRILF